MSQPSSKREHGLSAHQATSSAGSHTEGRAVTSSSPPDTTHTDEFAPRLLAAISQAVFACDFDGAIVYWNPAAEQFYGWTAKEALGQSILEMIEDTAIRSSVADVLTIMRERREWVREVSVQRRDGTRFSAEVSLSQIRNESGEPIGIVAISADISRRKKAEEALIASESRLRRLEESDLIGIIRGGLDGGISAANDAFLNMLGYSREDLLAGLRWDDLTPPEFSEIDKQIIQEIQDTGVSAPKEKAYFHKDGSQIRIVLGSASLESPEGEVIAFVLDISDRKRADLERELLLAAEHSARVEAGNARFQAEQLLEITAAYSRARTPTEVVHATVEMGIAALGADAGVIALMTDSGDALEVAQSSGYPPETIDAWRTRSIPLTADFPITDAVLKAETIWIPSRAELLEQYPALRDVPASYSAGSVSLPLIADSQILGSLGLSFAEVHEFPPAERVFAETLARFCAQALERTRLFAREQEARLEGDAAQRRAIGLFRLTSALSRAITPQEVATAAIEQGLGALNVDAGLIALVTADGTALDVIQTHGYPSDIVERWHAAPIPIDHPVPIARAALDGEPIWIRSREELLERFPYMRQHSTVFSHAFAAVPLTASNRKLGTLGLSFGSQREITESERTYVVTLARLCSQALERAYLFATERDARVAAEAAQQRLSLLAVASDLLATSLDMNDVLPAITRVMVPKMADWCVIDIVGDNGLPERIAVMHVDPEKVRWAAELQNRTPFDPDAPTGLAKVLRTGETEFYPTITDEMLVAVAQDKEHLELIRSVGFSSALIVPLIARGRTLGAITLVHAESGRHYTGEDLVLTENLAYRAALAVDNARLYEQAREAVRLREEFLSIASHEIRTPMTTITGFAHLLTRHLTQDNIDESRVETLSNRLLEEAERLNHIVTDLLDVSRIQQGQLALNREACDLSGLARQVAERLSSAQERSNRRNVTVQAAAPVVGDWDPNRLDQVLTNLISNAIKYSTEGDVTVSVVARGDEAVVTVADRGIGIPEEQQARLFEPFVRGDTAHHSSSGAGLGLYITRQIVERHQGSISLESRPGEGTTVTVRLPLHGEE